MEVISFKAESRNEIGTSGSRRSRKEGMIPAVLYGKDSVKHFSVTKKQVKPLIYTGDFKVAEVEIDGSVHKCFLKDFQMHPVSENIQHLDFLLLTDGHPVKLELPVRFEGTAPGIKEGGKFQTLVRKVKVKSLPEKLVEELKIDVSELELGGSVRIKDIIENEGIEILSNPNIPVASVIVPRAAKALAAEEEAAAAAEAAEGAAAAEGAEGAAPAAEAPAS